ncbi:MAG: UDP-N-acetylglucosamine diphosphorylase/glucosamine-1-phosphate N-acetyltransferase [Halobacteriovorax sp.]|nr:UDP-N-acetylglucosamine diphosphorylase/glucosamine-1-phosphate N-acetyltransferase [Halobacteriovorax sp.]
MDEFGIVILAAGAGTRLKMPLPKPLAPMSGRKMMDYSFGAAADFLERHKRTGKICLVLGHGKELVEAHMHKTWSDKPWESAFQKQQIGTADALRSYFNDISDAKNRKYTIVLCADTPLITESEITSLVNILESENLDAVAATFVEDKPKGYGRIVRAKQGFHIVEEKDASDEQRKITEVNSGLYVMKTDFISKYLFELKSENKSKEFYLTDLFQDDRNVKAITFSDKSPFAGVNTIAHLEDAQKQLRARYIANARENGVRFMAADQVLIDDTVALGEGVQIYPGCVLEGDTVIGDNVILESGVIVKDSSIASNSKILAYSYLEKAHVAEEASVGPFARLREGTVVGARSKIGNFVETKKAVLQEEVKVSHLSYVGDAEIGARTNIGCGFITCNYDGAQKHKTIIGKDSFIGSDSQMIAPINIGDGCYVASGSSINQDMEAGDFAIARSKQVTKKGMAKRFIKSSKKND